MSRAFLFPGQGSQSVGMGLDLAQNFPAARQVFAEVDEALHQNLSRLIWEGPDDTLTLTENAQPALMAVSMAVLRVIESESGKSLSDLCPSSPVIRSANTARLPLRVPYRWPIPRGC